MVLTTPDFALPSPNPRRDNTTDAVWWLRCQLLALQAGTQDGGTYANKKGFHNKGKQCKDLGAYNSGTDYSIRQAINRAGSWWRDFSSAHDWTFTNAQGGNYSTIALYTKRLMDAALDSSDPRLDALYEFYGQADTDSHVEGWNEWEERDVTSDSSHLWHIHTSFLRKFCGDFWQMWAIYTVLSGQTKAHWLSTLPGAGGPPVETPPPPIQVPSGLPVHAPGSRTLRNVTPDTKGTDVLFLQKFIGPTRCGPADGGYGNKTESGVRWYQGIRGIKVDGIAGPQVWRNIGV
jgi:peptidoglycan hydrolase-like protein with peptidoglycan-binding domain